MYVNFISDEKHTYVSTKIMDLNVFLQSYDN